MNLCPCGRRYEIDDDLEYRCFTCQPRPPSGWLARSIAEAKQSRATAERSDRSRDTNEPALAALKLSGAK